MATTLLAFLSEVSDVTGKRLVLRFDAGEVLAESDFALLGELASRSIDNFLMLVTVNSNHPGLSGKLAVLEARGAHLYDLSPLTTGEIEGWLTEALVPEEFWPTIIRKSAGYPFFIDELVAIYNAGGLDRVIATPDGFDRLLSVTWATLDRQQQVIATSLACLPEPPSADFVSDLIGIDPVEWLMIRRSLQDSRVFITRPDGAIWFHDRRRDFIWRELEPDAKVALADRALGALQNDIDATGGASEWMFVAIPGLLRAGAPIVLADPYLSQIIQLSLDELAIMSALIELTEPGTEAGSVVDTAGLGRFARSRLDLPEDPIAAFESLANRGFLSLKSNNRASVTAGIFPSSFAFMCLIAQIGEDLRRKPVPRLGTSTFYRFIQPLIGRFELANISVGRGSLLNHRNSFDSMRKAHLNDRDIGVLPSLGIDVVLGSQGIHTTVVFKTSEDRDAAEAVLSEYVSDTGPGALRITATNRLPASRIRFSRIARALERFGSDPIATTNLERTQQATRIMEALRTTLTPDEASALNWSEPRSILIDIADSSSWAEVRLRGGSEANVTEFLLEDRHGLSNDPLLELKLRRDGLIGNDQLMEGWSVRSGSRSSIGSSPLKEVLDEFQKRAKAYNRGLANVLVPSDGTELENLIRQERVANSAMLKRLVEVGLVDAMPPNDDSSIYLFLYPEDGGGMFIGAWGAYAIEAGDHKSDVVVRILSADEPHPPFMLTDEECVQFNLPLTGTHLRGNEGFAEHVIAEHLGWDDDDIRIARMHPLGE